MATDVFGRQPLAFSGAFSADAALITFSGIAGGGAGLLTQKLSFSYTQRVSRIYEIGSRAVFYVVGRVMGDFSASRVAGPRPISLAFYSVYGNPCTAGTLLFNVAVGCTTNDLPGSLSLTLTGVLLTTVQYSVEAELMIVSEGLQGIFAALLV